MIVPAMNLNEKANRQYLVSVIRDERKRRGITQTKMANDLGVWATDLSAYEQGRRTPEPTRLRAMLRYFNITSEEPKVIEEQVPPPADPLHDQASRLAAFILKVQPNPTLDDLNDLMAEDVALIHSLRRLPPGPPNTIVRTPYPTKP